MNREITDRKKEASPERVDKSTRTEESRAMELHEMHKRAVMNMDYENPIYVDPALVPQGMEYHWVRVSVNNEPDSAQMISYAKKGWSTVPATRHPELSFHDPFGRNSHMSSHIFYKGLVLCERNAELGRLETDKYAKMNYQNLVSLQGTDNYMGEPTIPVRNNSQTYTSTAISGN